MIGKDQILIERHFYGNVSSIFQAKVLAILRYVENFIERERYNNRIYICSDSRATINALIKTTMES